jgi:hypothetical protein
MRAGLWRASGGEIKAAPTPVGAAANDDPAVCDSLEMRNKMQPQALIYDDPRPLTKDRHREWSVEPRGSYEFARKINAVPLVTTEFEIAAREYPVVFTEAGNTISPAALLGLRDGENLFVAPDGSWSAKYVPAFIRRYPFVFGHDPKSQTYTLCIDEASERCNTDHQGNSLFDEQGEPSRYTQRKLDLLKKWQKGLQDSQAFCSRLRDMDLLRPSQINFTLTAGQRAKTKGFLAVDRDRLQALPVESVVELHQSGELGLIHAHLMSLHCMQTLHERLEHAGSLQ